VTDELASEAVGGTAGGPGDAEGSDGVGTPIAGDVVVADILDVALAHSVAAALETVAGAQAMGLGMLTAQQLQLNDSISANAVLAATCARLVALPADEEALRKPGTAGSADVLDGARAQGEMALALIESAPRMSGDTARALELIDSFIAEADRVRSALAAAADAGPADMNMAGPEDEAAAAADSGAARGAS